MVHEDKFIDSLVQIFWYLMFWLFIPSVMERLILNLWLSSLKISPALDSFILKFYYEVHTPLRWLCPLDELTLSHYETTFFIPGSILFVLASICLI